MALTLEEWGCVLSTAYNQLICYNIFLTFIFQKKQGESHLKPQNPFNSRTFFHADADKRKNFFSFLLLYDSAGK